MLPRQAHGGEFANFIVTSRIHYGIPYRLQDVHKNNYKHFLSSNTVEQDVVHLKHYAAVYYQL